jgi:hypothetical protein
MQLQSPDKSVSEPLRDDEIQFIEALTTPGYEITVVEESNPDPDRLWDQLDLCLRIHKKAEAAMLRVRPLIGKFLQIAKENPKVYENRGFNNFTDFVNLFVCGQMGLSRAALYETKRVAEKLPSISPEEYAELGPTKALTLAKFTRSSDPSFPSYLAEAKSRTATGFIKWCEDKGMIEEGEMDAATIVIHTTKTIEHEWVNFRSEAAIQAHVGSNNEGEILRALIQEGHFWIVPERT